MQENIVVKGAKENNLKNINVTIPRNKIGVLFCIESDSRGIISQLRGHELIKKLILI